jgi:MEMO1 family protein
MGFIRQPAVAGAFYPANPATLAGAVDEFISRAAPAGASLVPKAIIAPHAGYPYSGAVAGTAYARLAAARGRIARVVVIGPSHHVAFRGIAVDNAVAWSTPLGAVALDAEAIAALLRLPGVGTLEAAFAREHALEVQLPFLVRALGSFRLVPLVTGDAAPEAVAAVLDAVWGGPETLIVVSSDLSHYLDDAAARAIDARTAGAIEHLDGAAIANDGACGRVGIRGLLLAARRHGLAIERLGLCNSGDTAGTRDHVVGYGAWALTAPATDEAALENDAAAAITEQGPLLLDLVRAGIEIGFDTGRPGRVRVDAPLPDLLRAPGAAFVTLRRGGRLRGCIGSPAARRALVVDVVEHAFNAAFRDPRFPPLALTELAGLELSVSVLTPPVPMRFTGEADLVAQLRPHRDGLIIRDGGHAALFLPSVWEELPDPRQFLAHLKRKAGMAPGDFSPAFTAERFGSVEVKGPMTAREDRPRLRGILA